MTYPERPFGETEAEFWKRVPPEPQDMSLDDLLRACCYAYMAGGVRRERQLAYGLGTTEARIQYWKEIRSCSNSKP